MIDDRTPNLNLAKPSSGNTLLEDVVRLRSAIDTLDTVVAGKQEALGFTPLNATQKGASNGVCELVEGFVPAIRLPSYVDDVLEFANFAAFPATGETGKIYVALNTNAQYRWSGSTYIQITAAPGTTDAVTEGSVNLYFTPARARAAQVPATEVTLGLVKAGSGLSVAVDGTMSLDAFTSFTEILVSITSNGQTAFVIDGGYTASSVQVLLNGVELLRNDDYYATDGLNLTLAQGVSTGDKLLLRSWQAVLNTGPVSIPAAPVNTSPVNGATLAAASTTFSGGVFLAPDGATHAATQLQFSTAANFAVVALDTGSIAASTSPSINVSSLDLSTTYFWRMRYQSSGGQWSAWSTPTTLVTPALFASYIPTPAATPAEFGDPLEGGFYAGMIWNQVTQSATNTTVGTGSKTFVTSDNMTTTPLFYQGQSVEVRSRANPSNKMFGTVTFAGGTTLTVNVGSVGGSGSFTDWSVMARYRVITAPKSSGEAVRQWGDSVSIPAAATPSEGYKATMAIVAAGLEATYPAAWFCKNLNIGGYSDWYLPAMCELELLVRNLRPTPGPAGTPTGQRPTMLTIAASLGSYAESSAAAQGSNSNSSPIGDPYSSVDVNQVAAGKGFRSGEAEALSVDVSYFSSTQNASTSAMSQNLGASSKYGLQAQAAKNIAAYVRAVRRSII